jgi:membrane-associated phospholipid phosphatase
MKQTILLLLFAMFISHPSTCGQLFDSEVYNVKWHTDIPIMVGAFATNYWGLQIVDRKGRLDSLTIINLDPNDINRFDRSATRQDAEFMKVAVDRSDIGMRGSFLLPVLLILDKDIRQDWAPIILLYLETEAIVGNLFSWGAAIHIDRIRPQVYNPDVAWGKRSGVRNKNSFYSGHTSSSAAASFFVAKVYCDYHPELERKKLIFYAIAAIPPAITGYYRYKGMKHFPTDVLTGLAIGATTGILVPHLHKKQNHNLSIIPVTGRYSGFAMTLKF